VGFAQHRAASLLAVAVSLIGLISFPVTARREFAAKPLTKPRYSARKSTRRSVFNAISLFFPCFQGI